MITHFVIVLLLIAVFGKWLLIALIFPFQVIAVNWTFKRNLTNWIMAIPYKVWDKYLCREGWTRYMLHEVAFIPSHHLRRFIYRSLGMKMGKNNVFHYGTELRDIHGISMGEGNSIGDNVILDGRRGLVIGNNVNFSSNVSVWTLQHDHRSPYFSCKLDGGKVIIEDRVWLGCNVIVLPGCRICEGAVLCAGCVVTKDVEPYTVVAGIPAKKVNERPHDLRYEFDDIVCRFL